MENLCEEENLEFSALFTEAFFIGFEILKNTEVIKYNHLFLIEIWAFHLAYLNLVYQIPWLIVFTITEDQY